MKKNLIILLLMVCGSAYGQAEQKSGIEIQTTVEQIAEFEGGSQEFMEYLAKNPLIFKDPSGKKPDAMVMVSFEVGIDGSIKNYKVQKKYQYGLSEENLKQIEDQGRFYLLGKKEEKE
ncbi:MAG: hypothetical protein RIR51_1542 [Bacteroidota bacterium]|jgi:hypothetical protein